MIIDIQLWYSFRKTKQESISECVSGVGGQTMQNNR